MVTNYENFSVAKHVKIPTQIQKCSNYFPEKNVRLEKNVVLTESQKLYNY